LLRTHRRNGKGAYGERQNECRAYQSCPHVP
jgi:hypothetical protein